MNAEAHALARIAESIADGRAIDWSAVEKSAAAVDRRFIRHLRVVESIATLHRTIADESETRQDESVAPEGPGWGRLILREQIGAGTSAEVFRAWDTSLHRDVALKLFRRDGAGPLATQARGLEEARRLARVRHPHVAHVYGAEQHGGRVGLWMELVRGESLETTVRDRGPLGPQEAALIGLDLCAALAAVHGVDLLHRDVKAQNVMRETGGRIVLMDFGTGEPIRENEGTARLVGTPLYLAPELFCGAPATVQSDLYSLGVLVFYLVTGRFPCTASSLRELVRAHADGVRRRLRDLRPDLPEPFVRVVERALDARPESRFGSAGEMEAALREALRLPATGVAAPRRLSWRSWVGIAAALAFVVAIAVLVTRSRSVAPAVSPVQRIAVLPLRDLSPAGDSSHLADALTEGLISTLGHGTDLGVISGTSSMQYRDTRQPAGDIARALEVDALVEGSVAVDREPTGLERVRLNVRVIAASTDTSMFSRSFVRPRGDLDALEREAVLSIARALRVELPADRASRLARVSVTSPEAERAYLEGRAALAQYGVEPALRAVDAFGRAVRLDANHAAAYAGLSRAYVTAGLFGGLLHQEARARGLAAARRALELDDELAEAHAALGNIEFFYDWNWTGAERSYQRSLTLNRSFTYARGYYAQFLASQQRFDEALAHATDALALDPRSSTAQFLPALVSYYRRDYQAAEGLLRTLPGREIMLGRVLEATGRIDEALELTGRIASAPEGGGVPVRVHLLRLQALAGRHDEAVAGLRALETDAQRGRGNVTARDIGYIYLALGRHDEATAAFERALRERDPTLVWFRVDPRLDPLRSDTRFRKILAAMQLDP